MGARRIRREQRQVDMAQSRHCNGILKAKERDRREVRMKALLSQGQLPYTPPVLSWLSVQLGKPGRLITQEEVNRFLAGGADRNKPKTGGKPAAAPKASASPNPG